MFKTITVDNRTEFETFTQFESLDTKVYRPLHLMGTPAERASQRHPPPIYPRIDGYSDEDILNIADEINSRPRRVLGYQTLAELFNTFFG